MAHTTHYTPHTPPQLCVAKQQLQLSTLRSAEKALEESYNNEIDAEGRRVEYEQVALAIESALEGNVSLRLRLRLKPGPGLRLRRDVRVRVKVSVIKYEMAGWTYET